MTRRYRFYDNTTENANISSVLDVSSRRVLRNTYFLLSICLAFSAITTAATIALQLPYPGFLITIVGYFGLLFLVTKNRNSGLGILFVLALTGFMGYTLGPIVGYYLRLPNGAQTVMMALGGTALISLSCQGSHFFPDVTFRFCPDF